MEHRFKYVLTTMALLVLGASHGQSIGSDYRLVSKKSRSHGRDIQVESTVERVGDSLVWCQKTIYNTINRQAYRIRSAEENWDRRTSSGKVRYTLDIPGFEGHFRIGGKASKKMAVLSIKRKGERAFTDYTFEIDAISYRPKQERP